MPSKHIKSSNFVIDLWKISKTCLNSTLIEPLCLVINDTMLQHLKFYIQYSNTIFIKDIKFKATTLLLLPASEDPSHYLNNNTCNPNKNRYYFKLVIIDLTEELQTLQSNTQWIKNK